MKVAIVNNGTGVPKKILELVKNHEVEVFDIQSASTLDTNGFDFLILSGSSQLPIEYSKERLQPEIDLITRSTIPTLGICYGCELIAVAFGATLKDRGENTQERKPILIKAVVDTTLFGEKKEFLVYDAHRWIIDTLPPEFEVLAESEHGPEIIKHKTRPLYGFQFHPEKMTDETFGDEIFEELMKMEVLSKEKYLL